MSLSARLMSVVLPITASVLAMNFMIGEAAHAASAKPPVAIEIAADLPDSSVELVGFLYLPPDLYRDVEPPLAVLLHQMGESHKVWDEFWSSLYVKGIAVLAIDLRGHGLSIYDLKFQRNRRANTFYEGEFLEYPNDVKFLVDTCIALHKDKIDESKIAVVGASIGANTALHYALMEPRVNYVGMVSPGLDYRGLTLPPSLAKISDVDIFLATAEHDVYSLLSVELLTDFFADKLEYEVYQTTHHGNRLVNSSPELFQKLLRDVVKHLRPDIELVE